MSYDLWKTQADGTLASESETYRLVVARFDGGTHFYVFRKRECPDEAGILVSSGIEPTSRQAMKKAMDLAKTLEAVQLSDLDAA